LSVALRPWPTREILRLVAVDGCVAVRDSARSGERLRIVRLGRPSVLRSRVFCVV
jgi:hypothetical protein